MYCISASINVLLTVISDRSSILVLDGKLNVLDEFRLQKEELTKKFEQQEEEQKLQELKHQETLHNIERDFILKKIQ
jgi:succinyl-CoA synthetase beta subunit